MVATFGGNVGIKAGSWAQATIALSVAEAETAALAKASVECLGQAARAEDFGLGKIKQRIMLRTDSTSLQGIVGRRGLGRLKH